MPEGDTVWRTARHLDRALAGHQLVRCDVRVPRYATTDLAGLTVNEVVSRGKHLLVRVGDTTIHSHLKMEGAWHVYPVAPGRPRWRRPAHTARIVLTTATTQAVGFSLGQLDIVGRSHEDEVVGHLGPDLLGSDWNLDLAVEHIRSQPDRPVFLALLDQRNLAGFGNEYVNELLFLGGLAPTRPVSDVPDLPRVIDRGRRLLELNASRIERSFTGSTRSQQTRWVYSRAGQRCRRCNTPIRRGDLGDDPTSERQTFWCPHCQPEAGAP